MVKPEKENGYISKSRINAKCHKMYMYCHPLLIADTYNVSLF